MTAAAVQFGSCQYRFPHAQQIRHLLTVKPRRLAVFISGKLSGIVNGIDTEVYNPVDDKYIAQTFTADTLEQRKLIKLFCKKKLV